MEKNFTELHVGGVYLRRDGGIDWIVKDDGSKFPYDSKNDYFYLKNGDYREFQEHDEDLVQYICEYSDIKRLPEIIEKSKILDKLINKLEEYKHKSGDEADEIAWEDYHTLVRAKFLINNAGLYL